MKNDKLKIKVPQELEGMDIDQILPPQERELLSPRELQAELQHKVEEMKKRRWMRLPPSQLVQRIPVSVFAMGQLATAT